MTDLDTVARAATRELLERTTPDVGSRYRELRRLRGRRTAAKVASVGAVAALAIGGWPLGGDSRPGQLEPAPPAPPAPQVQVHVTNGTLVAARPAGGSYDRVAVMGPQLANLPVVGKGHAALQFVGDGASAVYDTGTGQLGVVDLATGESSRLVDCPDGNCDGSLSPDGTTVAYPRGGDVLTLQDVVSGETHDLSVEAPGPLATPSWSPDGRSLAFAAVDGIYTIGADGGALRKLHSSRVMLGGTSVAWSPDGSRVAFFDIRRAGADGSVLAFTAMTVGRDGENPVSVHDAGQCVCINRPRPSLTWSPDGTLLAVASTTMSSGMGVHTVRPDGADWQLRLGGYFASLAWQPVIE